MLPNAAIVTGASRGIGLAISAALLRHNVTVIGVARSADRLEAAATKLSTSTAKFIPCVGDIKNSADQAKAVSAAKPYNLIALINNAGVLEPIEKLATASLDAWKHHFDVNLFSVLALTQLALPRLRESHGCIVNVSSGAATHAYQGWAAYCASKAALNMMTKSIAAEEENVVAVAIRPGVVDTDMQVLIRDEGAAGMVREELAKFVDLHDQKMLLPPEKPAAVIADLAVAAPKELSGGFYSWDSDEIKPYI